MRPPTFSLRLGSGWLAGLALLLAGGCRVDATVETKVEGGGGVVTARFTLDPEAVSILGGGDLVAGAQATDLRAAGWTIGTPARTEAGGSRVSVSKRFGRPEDLGRVVGELAGENGPLQGFRLVRRRSFASTRYRLEGRADLRGGAAATGFENAVGLADRIRSAGVDPDRVEELITTRAVEGFALRVVADLPGGEPVAREVPFGEAVELVATARTTDRARPALLVVAVALAAAAVVLVRRDRR